MTDTLYYLKPQIISQPLVNNWFAWSFLVTPQTAAMLIRFSHLPIMYSYINNPAFHEQALKQPELKGGPFIDLPQREIDSINYLIQNTEKEAKLLLSLADATIKLFDQLEKHQKGASLEALYHELPYELRGYVELVYDLQNQISFRFIEALLYESPYATRSLQSVVISETKSESRPFLLSTPYIKSVDKIQIKLPFLNEFYDTLYATKTKPVTEEELLRLYNKIPESDQYSFALFKSFFISKPFYSKSYPKVDSPMIKIRYLGHACIIIESENISILIDPIISYETDGHIEKFTYADLPEKIDYLIITHAHQDHVVIEHLLQLRHKTHTVIVPKSSGGFLQDPSLKLFFKELGFKNVLDIEDMESIAIPGGEILGLPFFGEHGDLHIQTKKAHLISLYNKKILCAADSNNISPDLYQLIFQRLGSIDVIFIGMECEGAPISWVYGTLLPKKLERKYDQSRRLNGSNCERALKIIETFQPKQIFVYAMALEPWLSYILNINYNENSVQLIESKKFVDQCNAIGIPAERLFAKKEFYI